MRIRTRSTAARAIQPAEASTRPPLALSRSENDALLRAEVRRRAAEARARHHKLCRDDVNAFIEHVIRDQESGDRVRQHPWHVELQSAITQRKRVVVMSHPESGKSTQVAVGRVLWELGRNPNKRVLLLCLTEEGAKKTLSEIKRYIETSEDLHQVFPELVRGPVWQDAKIVVSRTMISRNPSIEAAGYGGTKIHGGRFDLIVVDDLLDVENTGTEEQRKKISKWFKLQALTRLTKSGVAVFLTNAWHPKDLAHELVQQRGWHFMRRPIYVANDNGDKVIAWERWTPERLAVAKKDFGPLEFARAFECEPRDVGSMIFTEEMLRAARARGKGYGFLKFLDIMPEDCLLVAGVDPAAAKTASAAKTAIVLVFFHPNQDRQVVLVRSGRWGAPKIKAELKLIAERFPDVFIAVESNAVQRWLVDLLREEDGVTVPVIPFNTGKNKTDPRYGVNSLSAEFDVDSQRWIFPTELSVDEAEEMDELDSQLQDYVPEKHTGDKLMACFAPGARVSTLSGLVPIEDVEVGDFVLTHTGSWGRVTSTLARRYDGKAFSMRMSGTAESFVVTEEHPMLVSGSRIKEIKRQKTTLTAPHGGWRWRPVRQVRIGGRRSSGHWFRVPVARWPQGPGAVDLAQYLVEPRRGGAKWSGTASRLFWRDETELPRMLRLDEEAGIVFGLYLAEGSVGLNGNCVMFALHSKENYIADFLAEFFRTRFGAASRWWVEPGTYRAVLLVRSSIAMRLFSEFGKKGKKHLPWRWMGGSDKFLAGVVRGWLVGDGSKKDLGIGGTSISKNLIYQMQQICLGLGIGGSVGVSEQGGTKVAFGNTGSVIQRAWLMRVSSSDLSRLGIGGHAIEKTRWGHLRASRRALPNSSLKVFDGVVATRAIEKTEIRYEGTVHNLQVEGDESYVVEGVAVHNCWIAREVGRRLHRWKHGTEDGAGGAQVLG